MSSRRSKYANIFEVRKRIDAEDEGEQPDLRISEQPQPESRKTAPDTLISDIPTADIQKAGYPDIQNEEALWRSRIERKFTGVRLPKDKLKVWKHLCIDRDVDFQDAVERGLDLYFGLTGYPDIQKAGQPDIQTTALINNDPNNQLVINGENESRILARYTELTGRSPTPKDVDRCREVAHLPVEFVLAQMPRIRDAAPGGGSNINGFGYFATALLKLGPPPVVKEPAAPQKHPSDCLRCHGAESGMEIVPGKGARPCPGYLPSAG